MDRARTALPLLLALCMVLGAGEAVGQIVYGQPASGNFGVIATSWTATVDGEESQLGQIMMPVSAFLPLRENLEARLFTAHVTNSLDQTGETFDLQGLADARVQLNGSLADDRMLLSLGVNLPTGKTGLDFDEEWVVMNALASDFLTYPSRRLGEGPGLYALVGGATMAGDTRLGASIRYDYAGSYEAYQDNGDYDPADAFSINVGLLRGQGRLSWQADATFSSYGDDAQDGRKVYSRGDQLSARVGCTYRGPRLRAAAAVRAFFRGRNAIYDSEEVLMNQLQIYGDEYAVTGSLSWTSADQRWSYGPVVDLRLIEANELGLGRARTLGAGLQAGRQLNERYRLQLGFKLFTGEADGGRLSLSGYQLSTSLGGTF